MKLRFFMGACAIATLATVPAAVAAEGAVRQGWWTAANARGSVPASLTGPDVPADGLLVQGGPSDTAPVAVSAIVVPVPADAIPSKLVVHLAEKGNSVPGSTLKACLLKSADFEPVQGGPMTKAPAYDCTDAEAVAAGGDDGKTFTFDAGRLLVGEAIAVALVAGTPPSRVVLAEPGDDVVTLITAGGMAGDFGTGWLADAGFADMGSFGALPALEPLPAVPTAPAATPTPVAATPGGSAAGALPAAFAVPVDPSANLAAVIGALFALAVAAGAWRLSGRRRPMVRVAAGSPASTQA